MDSVRVRTGDLLAVGLVELTFLDDGGGEPFEVVGRVLADHGDAVALLPGQAGTAVWNEAYTYPIEWDS